MNTALASAAQARGSSGPYGKRTERPQHHTAQIDHAKSAGSHWSLRPGGCCMVLQTMVVRGIESGFA